jgi:hypothetical protein
VPLGDETLLASSPTGDDEVYTVLTFPQATPRQDGFVVSWTTSYSRYFASSLLGWGAGVTGREIAPDGQPAAASLPLVPVAPPARHRPGGPGPGSGGRLCDRLG